MPSTTEDPFLKVTPDEMDQLHVALEIVLGEFGESGDLDSRLEYYRDVGWDDPADQLQHAFRAVEIWQRRQGGSPQELRNALRQLAEARVRIGYTIEPPRPAAAALDGAVSMPKEIADAAVVLIGELLDPDYDPRMEADGDDESAEAADQLEAARALYVEWRDDGVGADHEQKLRAMSEEQLLGRWRRLNRRHSNAVARFCDELNRRKALAPTANRRRKRAPAKDDGQADFQAAFDREFGPARG